jgi:hypothetical protein
MGKAGPLETGRGKYSPPASPERVTSEALSERITVFTNEEQIPMKDQSVTKNRCGNPGNSGSYFPLTASYPWNIVENNCFSKPDFDAKNGQTEYGD